MIHFDGVVFDRALIGSFVGGERKMKRVGQPQDGHLVGPSWASSWPVLGLPIDWYKLPWTFHFILIGPILGWGSWWAKK